ncbi:MAG: anion transporter [archaeon]|nr:anion transporter [archaeon]MCP8305580.1 anion transporter [archaeon]
MITALIILIITYVGISFTRLPKVNIDRPAAAFIGAILMVLAGVLTVQEAVAAIDFNTIALLLGMMIIIATLEEDGFLTFLAVRSMHIAKNPRRLLMVVIFATGFLSAFLVNDAVVLLFTPVIIETCRLMNIKNPVPYLIAEAMASNIGGVMTITGNPQNMLIGIASGISYIDFFLYLFPVAVISTIVLILTMRFVYKKDLDNEALKIGNSVNVDDFDFKFRPSLPILLFTMSLFFLSSYIGLNISMIALVGSALMLIFARIKPSNIISKVNWVLLLFFVGLFVVIGGATKAGIFDTLLNEINLSPNVEGILSLNIFSASISQIVSNVPLTMLVIPLIRNIEGNVLWISLAAGSTLGGNATLIGAVANIIVAEEADKKGVRVSFKEFLKAGVLVTALTILVSILVLTVEHNLGFLI